MPIRLGEMRTYPKRRAKAARELHAVVVRLVVVVFVGSAVVCAALIAPVLWRVATENVFHSGLTHD
jgi:hypothetical protein